MADDEAYATAAAAALAEQENVVQETQQQKDAEAAMVARRSKLDLSREKMEAFKKRAEKRGVVRPLI